MNWTRIVVAALVGGLVNNVINFLAHGLALGNTYREYAGVFSQEQANPLWFLLIAVVAGFFLAILFSKTRAAWGSGVRGGMIFGALVGTIAGLLHFFQPLVIDGFPYYLAWCWLSIEIIAFAVEGAVLALILKHP